MSSWWVLWLAFMVFFVLSPIGYGWGVRGWGLPYPRYVQHRRHHRAAAAHVHGSAVFDHHAWGVGGDFIWILLTVGLIWAVTAYLWR